MDIIKYLVEIGSDIHHTDNFNDNAFTLACGYNSNVKMHAAKYLIEIGIDQNSVDNNGDNGFMLACGFNSNIDVIKYLIDIGIDKNNVDKDGEIMHLCGRVVTIPTLMLLNIYWK